MSTVAGFGVEEFELHRRHLMGVAYRMLGTAAETEDIVQETWLRWREAPRHDVLNPRSYLTTIATRLCLDYLKSARVQREQYVGQWLPEPVPAREFIGAGSPEATVEAMESISYATMVVLERLSPLERAVFLLRDVFDFDYAEIANVVGTDEATCRQVQRRARRRLTEGEKRFESSYQERLRLTLEFLRAAGAGDFTGLRELLAEDVVQWGDGGGRMRAGLNPIYGREKVTRLIEHNAHKVWFDAIQIIDLNGAPAAVLTTNGLPVDIILFQTQHGLITEMWQVRNPDKMHAVRRYLAAAPPPVQ